MGEPMKSCPFCGNRDIRVQWVDWAYRAVCTEPTPPQLVDVLGPGGTGCGAYGGRANTEQKALSLWNLRATHS